MRCRARLERRTSYLDRVDGQTDRRVVGRGGRAIFWGVTLIQLSPARLERESRRADEDFAQELAWRLRRRRHVGAAALCVSAGLVLSGAAFGVTDVDIGNVLLLAGMALGNVGVIAVMMVYLATNED